MKPTKIDKFIEQYCQENKIRVLIDPKLEKDNGLCYPPYREIHLAKKYSSNKIKLVIFLHESGHIHIDGLREKPYNIFECELFSWTHAIKTHKKYFGKSFSKTQVEFMLKCLKSYCRSQYEFRRTKTQS